MCGRIGLAYSWKQLWELFNLPGPVPEEGIRVLNLGPSWKTGDTFHWNRVPVVRATASGREAAGLVWPLIPVWVKGELPKFSTANCRSEAGVPFSETVRHKPTFRGAWKAQRRCLVPVSWFYEWDQRSKPKQPWRILPRQGCFLVMAGLWDRSPLPDGSDLESFTIVTTEPNQLLRDIGHHRAPVMIDSDQWDTWLSGAPEQAETLIRPPPDDLMRAHQVTTRVNNPGYQGDDLPEDLAEKDRAV
jgi:putative SOS response-associated peptidase YedK